MDKRRKRVVSEGIIIAIIGGAVTVIAAIIGLIAKSSSKNKQKNVVKQKQKGNGNNQIGIQNITKEERENV